MKNVDNLLDKCSLGLFSPILQLAQMQNEEKQLQVDTIKNLSRFSSYLECKIDQCQNENLREHFHCYDLPCSGKILSKKEEIIRHIKWHKKRNESLNHGFLRFSSSDDCSIRFNNKYCQHNHKQTHYHCFQPNCDKIYISTSDVQMHSNYHRKDSAIFQEGFQRFRATEECNADYCIFSGQRTTHFHCRRDNCRFTFKNKADMEKHKSYHIKDLQLARDGFKKFLKNELCSYEGCRFSNVCNHIHCVRENCYYVLHSSGQLLSHKRKHDRLDGEQAYRRYKLLQKQAYNTDNNSKNIINITDNNISNINDYNNEIDSNNSDLLQNLLELSSTDNIIPSTINNSITTESVPIDLTYLYNSNSINNKYNNNNNQQLNTNIPQPSSSSSVAATNLPSIEFMKQMQERHQQLLKQSTTNFNLINEHKQLYDNQNLLLSIMLNNFKKITSKSSSSVLNKDINNVEDIDIIIRKYFTSNCTNQINNLIKSNNIDNDHIDNTILSSINNNINDDEQPLNLNLQNNNENTILIECSLPKSSSSSSTSKLSDTSILIQSHLHCLYKDCGQIIGQNLIELIEHIQLHEFNKNNDNDIILTNTSSSSSTNNLMQITSIDGFFNRKRGRPPKNRIVELYNNKQESPEAIFTSFKLEKNCNSGETQQQQQVSPTISSASTQTFTNVYQTYQPLLTTTASLSSAAASSTSTNLSAIKTTEAATASTINQLITTNKYENDDEKKSVVRAAGTYFPINTSAINTNINVINDQLQENNQLEDNHNIQDNNQSLTLSLTCNRAFCKLKKSHEHCEFCNQAFSDDIKYQIHKLKHSTTILKTLNQYDNDMNKNIENINNNDQPEDLSIPQSSSTNNLDLKESSSSTEISPITLLNQYDKLPIISRKIQNIYQQQQLLLNNPNANNNVSVMQNLHLAQLALYQQTTPSSLSSSYYCQNFYPSILESSVQQNEQNNNNQKLSNLFPLLINSTTKQQQSPTPIGKEKLIKNCINDKSILNNKKLSYKRKLSSSSNYDNNNIIDDDILINLKNQSKIKKLFKSSSITSSSTSTTTTTTTSSSSINYITTSTTRQCGNLKIFKDEPIPNGYLKFRFNEDCNFINCGYRNHQSHFHCIRNDCFYSFCDKTRFVQHTARHERLDKLMGDDFKQYRANMKCNYDECAYNKNWAGQNNKSSHFHCLKCNFICSDTNKVVAHRRQHNKAEFIRMAGFRKIANNEKCMINLINIDNQQNDECSYSLKQTHYHCLICDVVVLSRAQLSSHKHRTI